MNKVLLCAALAGMVTGATALNAQAADDSHAGMDKCYGIALAGKNDCKAADSSHSCQGQATADHNANDWNYVKAGECAGKGGSLEAGKK